MRKVKPVIVEEWQGQSFEAKASAESSVMGGQLQGTNFSASSLPFLDANALRTTLSRKKSLPGRFTVVEESDSCVTYNTSGFLQTCQLNSVLRLCYLRQILTF